MGIICSLIDVTKRTAKIFFCGLAESVFNVAMIRFKVLLVVDGNLLQRDMTFLKSQKENSEKKCID